SLAQTHTPPPAPGDRNTPAIPPPCMAELRSAVDKPPMRSEIQPQIWRLSNPTPSRTDSMAAPTVADMPRSLHSATRCACGIDIVTQHRNAASERRPNTTLAFHP